MPTMNLGGPVGHAEPAAPDLRTALLATRADHAWWETTPGRLFLNSAQLTLTPLARKLDADPGDALSIAYEVWGSLTPTLIDDEATDLWAYTRSAVRRALSREQEARRKSTSVEGIRRAGARELDTIGQLEDIEVAYFDAHSDDMPTPDTTSLARQPHGQRALDALRQVLLVAGLTDAQRDVLVDHFADIAATAPSNRAAIERATATPVLMTTPLTSAQWADLVEIILGTPAGLPGVMLLAADGHPSPTAERHISGRLMNLLMPQTPAVAA